MLRRLLCFNLCMSYEDVKDVENVDNVIDNLYNQILENQQGIDKDGMGNIAEAYYIFKSEKDNKQHFLIGKSKDKKLDKSMQKIYSKTLIPERSIDFNSALNTFKELTGEKQFLDSPK